MKIVISEIQLKSLVEQIKTNQTKVNSSFVTTKNNVLTKDTLTGGDLKIPKGTKFTAHQSGDKNDKSMGGIIFTASVDRIEGGKTKPSTVYYCNGTNAGKFYHNDSKSWYYDKTKVLSGYLSKNICGKSYGDQNYFVTKEKKDTEKQLKERSNYCAKNGQFVDKNGKKTCYETSTEFEKNYNFLKSQGLLVDGIQGYTMPTPTNPNQHFNYVALFSVKYLTDVQANSVGWSNTECMAIGLSSIGNVKMKSKLLTAYDANLIQMMNDEKSRIYTLIDVKTEPKYANFFLSDFYFQFGKLVKDVSNSVNVPYTVYFPDGVYSFMTSYFGTTNVSQISNVLKRTKSRCAGGGLTPEQGHKAISTLALVSAFIPVVGPFLAAGLGTADAAILWNEGKKAEAGLTFALSVIPFASKIPGLKNVGQGVFNSIASKFVKKLPFTPEELNVIQKMTNAKSEIDELTKKFIASKVQNNTVKELINVAKTKGEDYLVGKVSEKVGVDLKKIPKSKTEALKTIKGEIKKTATNLAKDATKSYDKKSTT